MNQVFQWILIISIYTGPNTPNRIEVQRFASHSDCVMATKLHVDHEGFRERCIMVPKEKR